MEKNKRRGVQMNTGTEYGWDAFDRRIVALESAVNNISAELGGWLAHDKRISALEHERHVWHEQENHLIDLCAEHEKRLAALEATDNRWDSQLEKRVSKLERRIAKLEDKEA
jgi:hypothetical protein